MKSDGYGDAFSRSLLEAGRMDGPAPDALERELTRLGLTVGAVVAATTTVAGSASGAAGLAANGAATTTALTATKGAAFLSSTIGKIVVGALAISSVGTTLVIAHASRAPEEAKLALSATVAPARPAVVPGSVREGTARTDEGAVDTMDRESAPEDVPPPVNETAKPPPIRTSAPPARGTPAFLPGSEPLVPTPEQPSRSAAVSASDVPPAPAASEPPPFTASTMAEQVMLLDRARAAAHLRPDEALAALDAYASRFPGGELTDQAAVVRVEALVALGDRSTALRVAAPYLRGNETSPIARRMRALLESPKAGAL